MRSELGAGLVDVDPPFLLSPEQRRVRCQGEPQGERGEGEARSAQELATSGTYQYQMEEEHGVGL